MAKMMSDMENPCLKYLVTSKYRLGKVAGGPANVRKSRRRSGEAKNPEKSPILP